MKTVIDHIDYNPLYHSVNHEGFMHYMRPSILRLRGYLQEKKAMGLLEAVELRDEYPAICFVLRGVYPKVWDKILKPGIKEYVELVTYSRATTANPTHSVWFRVKEKT